MMIHVPYKYLGHPKARLKPNTGALVRGKLKVHTADFFMYHCKSLNSGSIWSHIAIVRLYTSSGTVV